MRTRTYVCPFCRKEEESIVISEYNKSNSKICSECSDQISHKKRAEKKILNRAEAIRKKEEEYHLDEILGGTI